MPHVTEPRALRTTLNVLKLRRHRFETAMVVRHSRREASVEEAFSVRCAVITGTLNSGSALNIQIWYTGSSYLRNVAVVDCRQSAM